MQGKIRCLYDELVPLSALRPSPHQRNKHPKDQIVRLAKILEYQGVRRPIQVSKRSGCIVVGHGMLEALKYAKWDTAPVNYQDFESDELEYAHCQADNALQGWAELDLSAINADLENLGPDFDLDMLGLQNFTLDMAEKEEPDLAGALAARFLVPPFTVLDTRQGYWQERAQMWAPLTGNLSETKESVLTTPGGILNEINEGSSNFDPVLAEVMFHWFNVPNGSILDPFGGEQTKGVVAGHMGHKYTAVEIRADQVALNQKHTNKYPNVKYHVGDSCQITKLVGPEQHDMVFTSPPYYDLEVYSATDLSALGTYAEFMRRYEEIFKQCVALLKPNRFLVIKVGEVRDKKTGAYRNFVGDNMALFTKLGLTYYNEFTLINAAGTAPMRARGAMKNRKAIKLHQNILVFYKGDPKTISQHFPVIEDATTEPVAEED